MSYTTGIKAKGKGRKSYYNIFNDVFLVRVDGMIKVGQLYVGTKNVGKRIKLKLEFV